jgi:hypothetical protein
LTDDALKTFFCPLTQLLTFGSVQTVRVEAITIVQPEQLLHWVIRPSGWVLGQRTRKPFGKRFTYLPIQAASYQAAFELIKLRIQPRPGYSWSFHPACLPPSSAAADDLEKQDA